MRYYRFISCAAMLPDLVSLALFVRAVETSSLSKAAEQSHIALPAVSRRIAILEYRYGTQLLYRSSQGVTPTPAGKALAFHARQMLEQAEKLQVDLSDYAKGIKGHIRIQANTSAITQFLPHDLAIFTEHFSDVKVELEERRSIEIAQALRDGKADIGVVMEGTPLDGLAYYEYRRDRLVAVVPRAHLLRSRKTAFANLLEYDFIGLDSSAALMRQLAAVAAHEGQALRLRMHVWSFEAVCKLVQAGMGIGVLPEVAARAFAEVMGLRLIGLTDEWAERRMYVCVRDPGSLPVVGRKLVEQLVGSDSLRSMRSPD